MTLRRRRILLGAAAAPLQACTSIGPRRLDRDQLDYARVMAESGKRQTLFNLVRMRYGEPPAFLAVSQVVSGYTLQSSFQAGFNAYPTARASDYGSFLGSAQFTDRPTFTLNPVTGEQFVQAYLRPFAPADVLPLIQGGIPVDLLFRLIAQSVGPIQNTHPLGGPNRSGSSEFLPLLALLLRLQEGGALRVRVRRENAHTRVFLAFDTRHAPALRGLAQQVYRQLSVDPALQEVEVVYGVAQSQPRAREIPVLTRSLLNVLYAIAAEIELPEADIAARRAPPTLREPGNPRPAIQVRTAAAEPALSYAAVRVGDAWYWVDDADYESKLAFTILELLKSVAEGQGGSAPPVLTIPAG
ncbi:hypothetical protein [Paracraurococcus lichenis]|uniref:Uncharacterized protein n=1 Tax=Paracraurococcus lichenis TaxID=3064888 RepID=A0ABT9E7B4_9PROT|nr:hypothetical protein [Paracraurococcus sp. LOR1-02]MDO9712036.1 hypothetical protein [Paracraurococcus sp. LOR1-02]